MEYTHDTVDGIYPAPPKGWLKSKQNNGMFTIYQLVQDFATIQSIMKQFPWSLEQIMDLR